MEKLLEDYLKTLPELFTLRAENERLKNEVEFLRKLITDKKENKSGCTFIPMGTKISDLPVTCYKIKLEEIISDRK